MPATKAALASGGMTHCCLQMRLENVFLSVRPIVLSLARSTMFSSTTFSSSRRSVHRAAPGAASRPERSAWPPRRRRRSAAWRNSGWLAGQHRLEAFLDQLLGGSARTSRRWCPAPRRSGCRSILRPASEASAFNRMRALVSNCAECLPLQEILEPLPLLLTELHDVLLYAISFAATNHLPS